MPTIKYSAGNHSVSEVPEPESSPLTITTAQPSHTHLDLRLAILGNRDRSVLLSLSAIETFTISKAHVQYASILLDTGTPGAHRHDSMDAFESTARQLTTRRSTAPWHTTAFCEVWPFTAA